MAKIMKSRRLRKRARKTLGALFMASAIAVAAIPVDGLQASTGENYQMGVTLEQGDTKIPFIKDTESIFATGDGVYQYAYVNLDGETGGNKVAVILGYNSSGHNLDGGKLVIPDTVNVFDKFTDSQGSSQGYVAVNNDLEFLYWRQNIQDTDRLGNPLFEQVDQTLTYYKLQLGGRILKDEWKSDAESGVRIPVQKINEEGKLLYLDDKNQETTEDTGRPQYWKDQNGNIIRFEEEEETIKVVDKSRPITHPEFYPCYYNTQNIEGGWGTLKPEEFYTWTNSDHDYGADESDKLTVSNFTITSDKRKQWITDVSVEYIGNQVLNKEEDGTVKAGAWITTEAVEESSGRTNGVFANQANITQLVIGPNLKGIGDYAFYYCVGLRSITLSNNLDAIGNHAFDKCMNLETIDIDINCNMTRIGDHAFLDCQGLKSFRMPTSVQSIGDGVFENCIALSTIDMTEGNRNVSLNTIGNHAFKNCRSLTSLVIPYNVTGNMFYDPDDSNHGNKLKLSMVEGCTALQSITVMNENTDFDEDTGNAYTFAKFKAEMPDTFYFEGVNTAGSSNEAREGTLHWTANDQSIAFKYLNSDVYEIVKTDDDGNRAVYRVNSNNELIYCQIPIGMEEVVMPSTIGPYKITAIGGTSFRNNCFLKKIVIPSSVQNIAESAFLGCHNLTDVIFESPVQCKIGTNAFKTQEATIHQTGCENATKPLPDNPVLTFTGDISYASGPFDYAMNPANNINAGTQGRTYIKYYSGWPTNLTVQYNETTDKNELVDYPILDELSNYKLSDYPYMTNEYVKAANEAVEAYNNANHDLTKLTDYQRQIINSALNISLPQGIESVKDGLFVEKESKEKSGVNKTLTTNGIAEILPNTFEGFTNLKSVYINGATSSIGDYAFKDCKKLDTVEISPNVNMLGVRPFAGCDALTDVSFQGGNNFVCDDAIIFGLNNGEKNTVVQCLETRGQKKGATSIKAEELAGVTGIAKEAFYDCAGLGSIDLKESSIDKVPEGAFAASAANKSTVYSIYLPKTCKQIQNEAFKNSAVRYVEIPGSVSYIDLNAFNTDKNSPKDAVKDDKGNIIDPAWETSHSIDFYCEPDSAANIYASNHSNINISDKPIEREWEVTFWVTDRGVEGAVPRILDEPQIVKDGEDAVPPEVPEYEGYKFLYWSPDYHGVGKNLDVTAVYEYIDPDTTKLEVTFLDHDDNVLKVDRVFPGDDAVPPAPDPVREGYRFTGWRPAFTNVTADMVTYAQYEKIDSEEFKYNVTFLDHDDTVLKVDRVTPGENAQPPLPPSRDGYIFAGWRPDYKEVQSDLTIYAQYEKIDSDDQKFIVRFIDYDDNVVNVQRVALGEDAMEPKDPVREGYRFTGWRPAFTNVTKDVDVYAQYVPLGWEPTPTPDPNATPNPNATPDPNATPTPGPSPTPAPGEPTPTPVPFYTLTVRNGSGSGSYVAGAQVIVIADNPDSNSEFSNWTVDPGTAVVASKDTIGTILTMPASNVTMTANYKARVNNGNGNTSTVTRPSGGSSSGGNTGTSSNGSSNGTTVVINKNGLSNTGVVSVTVNGSSDNFVVKISEDANATEAALRALMNEYSDMSKIAYFPMDISLYDSTGTTKITDTTGLTVNITLPIPDSMIPYAGNNKVAGVVNGQLDKLVPKFTTISGVPCISFTATHFSPYVIYVDTSNLSEAAIRDNTPKTGDGIHPKWFLAMGLACISFVLFIKKDKRAVPVKVAAAR